MDDLPTTPIPSEASGLLPPSFSIPSCKEYGTAMPPKPVYEDASLIPLIKDGRHAPLRAQQLIAAASRDHDDPPPPPGLDECCGSSCQPCVKELWAQETKAWKIRWGLAKDKMPVVRGARNADAKVKVDSLREKEKERKEEKREEDKTEVKEPGSCMPGAFLDW